MLKRLAPAAGAVGQGRANLLLGTGHREEQRQQCLEWSSRVCRRGLPKTVGYKVTVLDTEVE